MKINFILFYQISNYSQNFRGKNMNSNVTGQSLQGSLPQQLVALPYIQDMYVRHSYT